MKYILLLLIVFLNSCTYNEFEVLEQCDYNDPNYLICIKPIIDRNCLACHYNGSDVGDFSNYDKLSLFVLNTDFIDRIQLDENEVGFMPLGNKKLSDEDIEVLIKWKLNGAKNN